MHHRQIYEAARIKNPWAFQMADEMVMKYLSRGMIIVRSMTIREQDSERQASEVEVLSFNWCVSGPKEKSHETLLRLKFRSDEDPKTMEMTDVIFVDGPLWNGKAMLTEDFVNQVLLVVQEWTEKEHFGWVAPDCLQFSGILKLKKGTLMKVNTPHHPLVLPMLSACLGHLCGSRPQKLDLIGRDVSSWSKAIRASALESLEHRLDAFVMQARHETAKMYFGDLV